MSQDKKKPGKAPVPKKKTKPEDGYEMIDEEEEALEEADRMSISGHLAELRNRLIICIVAFVAAFGIALWQSGPLTTLLLSRGSQFSFVFISPAELMMNYFRIAMIGGVVIAVPVIAYHIWQFLRPGLKVKEKRFFALVMTIGLGLFVLGVLFAFYIALPIILNFFASLDASQTIKPMISVQEYISYFLTTMIIFGVIFECPIVICSLVGVGIVKPQTLQKSFKYVVIGIFTVGAIITPPDVTSQILVSVPLMLLYEGSVLLSRFLFRRKLKEREEEERELEEYVEEDEDEED